MQTATIERVAISPERDVKNATQVWVFYNSPTGSRSIAEHKVKQDGTVGAGRWLSTKAVRKSILSLEERQEQRADAAFIPYRILSTTDDRTVWHVPPAERSITFTAKRMQPLSGMRQMPGLVFAAEKDKLYVYLVKDTELRPDTQLHIAPFPNIFGNNDVCNGSMPTYGSQPADIEDWTDAFFDSEFTHDTFFSWWSAVAKGKTPKLPKKADLTINDII